MGKEKTKRSCGICLDPISRHSSQLWAPCCGGFFDSQCVSKLAATSGYFFKCPLCNNKDVFNIEMKKFGIHVPDQDADWEKEPGAYSALLERYTRCDAEVCSSEDGRNYDEDDTIYEIILCRSCGSSGIHIQCGKLKLSDPVFLCTVCKGPEMAKENETGRRKSSRGKPSDVEPTTSPRKLQLGKVTKSPSPSKNPRKNKCSLPSLEKPLKSENASEETIGKPLETNSKPRRGRPKVVKTNEEDTVTKNVSSDSNSKNRRGSKKNDTVIPDCTQIPLNGDSDQKQESAQVKRNSRERKGNDFILLADTRQPEIDTNLKQNGIGDETGESSQLHINAKADSETNTVVIKIDPSILDVPTKSEIVKNEVHEEELDTELFDLANQINFNFEIPSSPLRPMNETTPSKLCTPIKNTPTKQLPRKNLIEEIYSSPLKDNRRGRLRTPQSTPIKENSVLKEVTKNPILTTPSASKRRSTRKSEQVHETREISKCALNLNELCNLDVHNKDQNLFDTEMISNKSLNKNSQIQPTKLNSLSNAVTVSKAESVGTESEGNNGETSRSKRGSRKRDCTSAGQSQQGYEPSPKPCKEKDQIISPKPLTIKLGLNNSPVTPANRNQEDKNTNPDSKLSAAEMRKNRLEHARIRVKINELMDELDSALA